MLDGVFPRAVVQHRVDGAAAKLRNYTEQHDAGAVNLARVPQDFENAGKHPAGAVVQEREIEIWETHSESHDLAATLGENDEVRLDDRLQLFAERVDVCVGERHTAPVLRPR